jgi:AhpD family alkylhydroperoxidase
MIDDSAAAGQRRQELSQRIQAFSAALRRDARLPARLIELVRLRIAFHNQCRPCMSMRNGAALDDGLTESVVCALARPEQADELNAAEKAAVAFADRFATDHLSVDAAMLLRLREHFDDDQLAELGALAGCFVGFGRMGAVFDSGEAWPVGPRKSDGTRLAPWEVAEPLVVR